MVPVKETVLREIKRGLLGSRAPSERVGLDELISHLGVRKLSPGWDAEVWERFNLRHPGSWVFDGSGDSRISLGLNLIAQAEIHRSGFDPGEVDQVTGRDGLFDELMDTGLSSGLSHNQWKLVLAGNFRGGIRRDVGGLVEFLALGSNNTQTKLSKEGVRIRVPNVRLDSPTIGEMVLVLSEAPRQKMTTMWVPMDNWARS